MSETPDCRPLLSALALPPALPTRQNNALRLLLNKREITPADVANLDHQDILRAPGIGPKSIGIIERWLRGHGLVLPKAPERTQHPRPCLRQRRLERAIDLLRDSGYEVRRVR